MRAITLLRVASSAEESVMKTAMAKRRPSGRVIRPISLVAGVISFDEAGRAGLMHHNGFRGQIALDLARAVGRISASISEEVWCVLV